MSLTLHVDGERWRAHLRAMADSHPGLVPVAKGNGYGFGNPRLARKSEWLGADTLAVGTYDEISDVSTRFSGDLVVLTPWRPWLEQPTDARVIHTVGRQADLEALIAPSINTGLPRTGLPRTGLPRTGLPRTGLPRTGRPRVILERLTSMNRHGFTARGLRTAVRVLKEMGGVQLEGVSLHLPLGPSSASGNLTEAETLMTDVVAADLPRPGGRPVTVWVSHLDPLALESLQLRYPDHRFRPRIGTGLWLGDREALRVSATVLDLHPIDRGEPFGYRGRTIARTGTLVIVSGGTAHGIGLESPTGEWSLRSRAATVARGGLDALGAVRSPYSVDGKLRFFAEPPHMQASMLFLPAGADLPEVGDQVDVRVRFTTTRFDRVEIS